MIKDLGLVNKLYYGDNLFIMREYIADETVDLVYLDPPFNSQATYNVLFQEKDGASSPAQITAFEDTWHWDMSAASAYEDLVTGGPAKLADLVQALRSFLGTNDMLAYLTMMAIRLVEMQRALKKTGSIYLHCDPTASHYLKLVMDAVFGASNYRNEIIWKRMSAHGNVYKSYGKIHDTLFFYTKTDRATWNSPRQEHDQEYIKKFFRYEDSQGRYRKQNVTNPATNRPNLTYEWHGNTRVWKWTREKMEEMDRQGLIGYTESGLPFLKQYLHETQKPAVQDIWLDIQSLQHAGHERLGYQTQKPEALIERVIEASSNEGDLVLDPFCGCGTTVAVAERLRRRWIGIDITHLAITLMERRLKDTFGKDLAPYRVIGDPKDLESARALAHSNRHQFEWWALSLVEARPAQDKKKGADTGIDGFINFFDDESGKAKKIVVQVKSGHTGVAQVRDLCHVVDREKAVIGVFITLQKPTGPMKEAAAGFGFYEPEHFPGKQYPRMQLLTIEELLAGAEVKYPKTLAPQATFKKAEKKKKQQTTTGSTDATTTESMFGNDS